MIRTVFAVMAGLLCALSGIRHAAVLKSDAARLTRWTALLEHLALLLREGTLSIPDALCAAADGIHPPDQLLRDIAGRMKAAPLLTAAEAFAQTGTGWLEQDMLARMFLRLGRGTQSSRCLALEQAAGEMRLLAQNASIRVEKDAKLWQTLGLTGGICLTIMLL